MSCYHYFSTPYLYWDSSKHSYGRKRKRIKIGKERYKCRDYIENAKESIVEYVLLEGRLVYQKTLIANNSKENVI